MSNPTGNLAVTSADRAYSYLKRAILDDVYASGARLPEDTIGGRLGLSRTPVRDALRRLEAEGLVSIAPNSGARVASWTRTELSEIGTMRTLLEGYAAELAAEKIGAAALADLESSCAAMAGAARGNGTADVAGIAAANLDFHRGIVAAADNRRLTAAIEPLWHLPITARTFSLFQPERIQRSIQHHLEIVAALKERDASWAGSIMRTHIRAARAYDRLLVPDDSRAADDD